MNPLRSKLKTSFSYENLEFAETNPHEETYKITSKNGQEPQEFFESILEESNKEDLRFNVKSLSCIFADNGKEYNNHWTAHYCTGTDDIEGILVLNAGTLTFTATRNFANLRNLSQQADNNDGKSEDYLKSLGNLEAVINLHDVFECKAMTFVVPTKEDNPNPNNAHILQLILHNHGEQSLHEEFDPILKDMQAKRTPYGCVYFNIKASQGPNNSIQESNQVLLQIQAQITSSVKDLKDKERPVSETRLPYFEFLTDNFGMKQIKYIRASSQIIKKNIKESLEKFREDEKKIQEAEDQKANNNVPQVIKKPRNIISAITLDTSRIVNSHQFSQIVSCVPDIYQMLEWKLLYSSVSHGTSFNNLMRRAKGASPFLIIIKDTANNVFGAYGSESLKFSQEYYGTGETFLFTFKDTNEIEEFNWSQKNSLYTFANEEGIMFGAGPFYGLWIDNELCRGRTHCCDTFGNKLLANNVDFDISKIEVWGVKDPFSSI